MKPEVIQQYIDTVRDAEQELARHQAEASETVELSPMERFVELGQRITDLADEADTARNPCLRVFFEGCHLTLTAYYSGRSNPSLSAVRALWQDDKEKIHEELLDIADINIFPDDPDTLETLALLEESVTAAENELAED